MVSEENKAKAEEAKTIGNVSFAAKDYDAAIESYSTCIRLDPSNHVYYSNRSACYSSKNEHAAAVADALLCVKLSPGFLKGYYRLVSGQLALGDLDGASNAVRAGLALDGDNAELRKQERTIKARRLEAESKARKAGGGSGQGPAGRAPSREAAKEALQLQDAMQSTSRELSEVKQYLKKCEREQKMAELTMAEIEAIPPTVNMYRGVGKMFVMAKKGEVISHMKKSTELERKKEKELTAKMEYLQKRQASQYANFQELNGVATAPQGGGEAVKKGAR